MKLAEALLLRADLQIKLAALQQRLHQNVLVQEGDEPSEDPEALLQEALTVNQELYILIKRIHQTNAQAITSSGKNLLSILNERDALTSQHRIIQQAIDQTQRENTRYSSNEIRWVKMLKIKPLQKRADEISAQLRQNNVEIQASNWLVDLL